MLCRNPYVTVAGSAFPCGQCKPCRLNRRRMWEHRIMLESFCHGDNAFVTLTYDDKHLPRVSEFGVPTLVPKHMQDWLKRLRLAVEPKRIRFYGVGEYGDGVAPDFVERSHYHLVIFGLPTCFRGRTLRIPGTGLRARWAECCDMCRLVGNTWGFGDVDLGTCTSDSASYCAEYTVKSMTKHDDIRLNGRHPEFCRMSLRPGIGADFMWDVASELLHYALDVPTSLAHGKGKKPLGRYLRGKLKMFTGREVNASVQELEKIAAEMLPLRLAARASSDAPGLKAHILAAGEGSYRQVMARELIFKKRKSL